MEQLTIQIRNFLMDNCPEIEVDEVYQVYQGNSSAIAAEIRDSSGNDLVVEINMASVTVKNLGDLNSQKYFIEYVQECNE
ncbi:MAG: hypothetical protein ACOCRK_07385 [bacterium]